MSVCKSLRRCLSVEKTKSARWPPNGSWTWPASNCETILVYSLTPVVYPLSICIQVQTCSPTFAALSKIVPRASGNTQSWKAKLLGLCKWSTSAFRLSVPEKSLVKSIWKMGSPLGSNSLSSVGRAFLLLHLRDVSLRKLSQQHSKKAPFLGTEPTCCFLLFCLFSVWGCLLEWCTTAWCFVGTSDGFADMRVGNSRHYSFCGAVFARCAKQALLNRHDFFVWKMAVDVAVVSCLSGLPDSPLSKRRPPGCSPNHSPQEGAWLCSFQRATRFVSNLRGVPSFC